MLGRHPQIDDRVIEYVDPLREHFLDPVRVHGGRCRVPSVPGLSAQMRPECAYPDRPVWVSRA